MNKMISRLSAVLIGFTMLAMGESLEVDKARSRIQVDAKATGHAFTGTLDNYTASVIGDAKTKEPTAFSLAWDFTDLKTADPKRDAEMVKWLGGGKPKGSFTLTKGWADAKGQRYIMGNLAIHGISKTISVPYTVKEEDGWVTINGTAGFDYESFGLPIIRAMAVMTVDPKLSVRFHLVGKLK